MEFETEYWRRSPPIQTVHAGLLSFPVHFGVISSPGFADQITPCITRLPKFCDFINYEVSSILVNCYITVVSPQSAL